MIPIGTYACIVPKPRSFQSGSPWAGQLVVVIAQSADQDDMVLVLRDPAKDDTWSHYRAHDRQGVYVNDLAVVVAVEAREDADAAEWVPVDYVDPYEVDDLNRRYGWDKYRIVTAEPQLSRPAVALLVEDEVQLNGGRRLLGAAPGARRRHVGWPVELI